MLQPLNRRGKNQCCQLFGRLGGPQTRLDVAKKKRIVSIPETKKPVALFVLNGFSGSVVLPTSKPSSTCRKYFEYLMLNM
jgi:hypothetical protein